MLLITFDGMTLEGALSRVRRLGDPLVPAQLVALTWFERNTSMMGYEKYLKLSRALTLAAKDNIDPASSRINLTIDILVEVGIIKSEGGLEETYAYLLKN